MRQAEHPNLLRYYCSEIDKQFIYIALELCEGDLDFYIRNRERFENLTPDRIIYQCASGIGQLHSLGVIHRDIKPSNILITYNNRKGERRAVIADFGLCRQGLGFKNKIFTHTELGSPDLDFRDILIYFFFDLIELPRCRKRFMTQKFNR